MKNIGLHFRFKRIITEVIEQALELNVSIFQCFFTDYIVKKHVQLNPSLIALFKTYSHKFNNLYAHGSYLINLADKRDHYILRHELELSKRLGFRYLVLHPGAIKPAVQTFEQGIDAIVYNINTLMTQEQDVILVLENAAFGGKAIGGDIQHFEHIFTRLDFPERVKFCLDTAHAHVFGYDLNNAITRNSFFQMLQRSAVKDFIQLLHLNNSHQELGSRIDNHAVLSEGKIELSSLQAFAQHPFFESKDIILELPELTNEFKKDVIIQVSNWFSPC